MQKGNRGEPIQGSVSKPILLGLITAIVIGIVAPIIMPHVTHPMMIYHIILHIASLTIAVFLSIVSVLAYRRSTGARLLFMSLGFIALATVEFMYLLDVTGIVSMDIATLNIELPHVILLAMLAMFGLGVLKVNK
jgi:predicted membrane chloride channel (bestrophin family)